MTKLGKISFVSGKQVNYLARPKTDENNWSVRHWQITLFCDNRDQRLFYNSITKFISISNHSLTAQGSNLPFFNNVGTDNCAWVEYYLRQKSFRRYYAWGDHYFFFRTSWKVSEVVHRSCTRLASRATNNGVQIAYMSCKNLRYIFDKSAAKTGRRLLFPSRKNVNDTGSVSEILKVVMFTSAVYFGLSNVTTRVILLTPEKNNRMWLYPLLLRICF